MRKLQSLLRSWLPKNTEDACVTLVGGESEREKGEELCPLVPPFSLLLRDEDELGFDVDALLENWRDLQSFQQMSGPLHRAP